MIYSKQNDRKLTESILKPIFFVNSYRSDIQAEPKIAAGYGMFAFVWESYNQVNSVDIFANIVFSNGNLLASSDLLVNTFTTYAQIHPDIAFLSSSQMVVIWDSSGDCSMLGCTENAGEIFGQMYQIDSNGFTKIGTQKIINEFISGTQRGKGIIPLPNGKFVVIWQSPQDQSGYGVYAKIFNSDWSVVKSEFKINLNTLGDQTEPLGIALDNGFIIAWQSSDNGGSDCNIAIQRFNFNGDAVGGEAIVNKTTTGNQQYPSITKLTNGNIVITWQSYNQDGSLWGVYYKVYDSNLNVILDETLASITTSDDQYHPKVSYTIDGGFTITWISDVSNQASTLLRRKFTASGTPDSSEIIVTQLNYNPSQSQADINIAVHDLKTLSDGKIAMVWKDYSSSTGYDILSQILQTDPSPTPTSSATLTSSATSSATLTFSATATISPTNSSSATFQSSVSPTNTETPSKTYSFATSISSAPTSSPSQSPAPAYTTSITPSFFPTYTQTHTAIASHSRPTIFYQRVDLLNVPNASGTSANENFIVDADDIALYGMGGIDKFTIVPRANGKLTIMDFELSEIIDLSWFSYIKKHSDIDISQQGISAGIYLPDGQIVLLNNVNVDNLSTSNFIIPSSTSLNSYTPVCDDTCTTVLEAAIPPIAAIFSAWLSHYFCIKNGQYHHNFYCDRIINPIATALNGFAWGNRNSGGEGPTAATSGDAAIAVSAGGSVSVGGTHNHYYTSDAKAASDLAYTNVYKKHPIGITLKENKEIELIKLEESKVYFDYDNDGKLERTSWVGSKDGILVYDHNNNGKVDDARKFVLTSWCKDAKTDFEALLCRFDSNEDKRFDKQDKEFDKFKIWQDKNQNGVSEEGELISLIEAGLSYIDFNTQQSAETIMKEEYGILNTAAVGWEDGKITQAYDLMFFHE